MRQIISFNNKNVVLPEPWVQPGPANDEIWYTSSDGNIVTPYSTSALPNIVSNTYSGDKGIIKFVSDVTSIGYRAFYYCLYLTSVQIPNSVTIIEQSAFNDCEGLTSVIIPNSVTSIGWYAFQYCSSLNFISYTGTMSQWNSISKSSGWNSFIPAKVVHCTDGDAPI